jgi:hypothetical protein
MHNEMSGRLARVLSRLRPHYTDVVAWVAPGLTHRSFVLEREQRAAHGVATSRLVAGVKLGLQGANDQLPPDFRVECLPTPKQLEAGKRRLAARLGRPVASIGGYYSRGGGGATPLALPELLRYLVSRLARDAGV